MHLYDFIYIYPYLVVDEKYCECEKSFYSKDFLVEFPLNYVMNIGEDFRWDTYIGDSIRWGFVFQQ